MIKKVTLNELRQRFEEELRAKTKYFSFVKNLSDGEYSSKETLKAWEIIKQSAISTGAIEL